MEPMERDFSQKVEPDFAEIELHYQKVVKGIELVFLVLCTMWERVEQEHIMPSQEFVDAWRAKQWELALDMMESCRDALEFTAMAHLLFEEANEHSLQVIRMLDHERRLYIRPVKEVLEQRTHRWQTRLERNFPDEKQREWILDRIPVARLTHLS